MVCPAACLVNPMLVVVSTEAQEGGAQGEWLLLRARRVALPHLQPGDEAQVVSTAQVLTPGAWSSGGSSALGR